jgi:hypothetical protein
MSFLGGALVGVVIGLGAGLLFGRSSRPDGSNRGGIAIVMAALALIASGIAVARSGSHDHTTAATGAVATQPAATTSTTGAALAPSTTPATAPGLVPGATVSVPQVVTFSRDAAVAALGKAGLKASVETLALANVPAGFVISQSPLPAAEVAVGTSVSLVVSSAT